VRGCVRASERQANERCVCEVWYVYAGWPVGAHRRRRGDGLLEAGSSQCASLCSRRAVLQEWANIAPSHPCAPTLPARPETTLRAERPSALRTTSHSNQDTTLTVLSSSCHPPAEFATNAAYAKWLDSIKAGHGSYVGCNLCANFDDGKVYEGIVASIRHLATRTQFQWRQPAANSQHPSRNRPFSIRWEDDTDSLIDMETLKECIALSTRGPRREVGSQLLQAQPIPIPDREPR
jgi:hypothetical protein